MPIQKEHSLLLLAICASMFSTPLMMAGINAVLPEIGVSLAASATQLSLVGALYTLGLAIFQMACGSLGDIMGHRRIFIMGGAIFGLASLLAGVPCGLYPFLGLRFIQGVGGAMLSASGLALIAAAAPPNQRASYLGLSGAAVYSGIACGPPIAGFVTAAIGWRWLFFINALTNLLVLIAMKLSHKLEWRPAQNQPFDLGGCLLYGAAIGSLTLAASQIGVSPLPGYGGILIFAVLLFLFIAREGKVAFPLLNLSLLRRNSTFSLSCLAALLNYASFFGVIFYFSFYLQLAKGLNVQQTGLVLAFQPLMQAFATPLATRLMHAWGAAWVSTAGNLCCGAGLLACAFLTHSTPLWVLFLAQAFLGMGMGAFSLSNTALILDSAGQTHIGQASALTGAARTAGQLFSMVLLTFILGLFLGQAVIEKSTLPSFMASMRLSLIIFGTLNIIGVSLTVFRNRQERKLFS